MANKNSQRHLFFNSKSLLITESHHKKALKFRGTKFLGNRPNLLGIPTFSEELMSWKNSWLQSKYRGNFRGTFVSEETCPRN
jgi:hypothetical protein